MTAYGDDIYSEPPVDPDTLANLGPLRAMAGTWEGEKGLDVKPKAEGAKTQAYIEHIDLQPIDGQTNGPQLLYGLRYHTFITKPGLTKAYHDQVGYWLWEPATGLILHTLAIPRGQVALAFGQAAAGDRSFEVSSARGTTANGICSNPFLEEAFRTDSFRMKVTLNDDGGWSYFEDTILQIRGQAEPFHHTDRNTLRKIAEPKLNPLALMAAGQDPT